MGVTAREAVATPVLPRRRSQEAGFAARARALWPSVFGFVFFFGAWELAVRVTNTPPFVIPAPSAIAGRFWQELPYLLEQLGVTLVGASIGFVIGLVVGVTGAVIMVHSRLLERSLFPIAVVIKLIPFIALAPMLIVWLGYDVKPKIFLAALITFFPVLVNCITGLRAVDPLALEFFRTMGASRWEILWQLRWPTSLPFLFAGLKIVAHLSVIGAIVAEYFGSRDGIGLVIMRTSESLQIQSLFATSLLLAIFGVLLILVTNVLERRALYWHESVRTSGGAS